MSVFANYQLPRFLDSFNIILIFSIFSFGFYNVKKISLPESSTLKIVEGFDSSNLKKGFQYCKNFSKVDEENVIVLVNGDSVYEFRRIFILGDYTINPNAPELKIKKSDRFIVEYTTNTYCNDAVGYIWSRDGVDIIQKYKELHNKYVSGYFWNYLLLLPSIIIFISYIKRKSNLLQSCIPLIILAALEIYRLYCCFY